MSPATWLTAACVCACARALPLAPGADSGSARGGRALFAPLALDPAGLLEYDDAFAAALASAQYAEPADPEPGDDNEILSRTRPGGKRPLGVGVGAGAGDSPIYYVRLPASPYVYLPGVGYVSEPPRPRPPPVVQTRPDSQLLTLPLRFAANGRPTGVYVLPPDSPVVALDKGPYVFDGRPAQIGLLRDAYNSLYADALDNFYP